jgi:hypothetical protein
VHSEHQGEKSALAVAAGSGSGHRR